MPGSHREAEGVGLDDAKGGLAIQRDQLGEGASFACASSVLYMEGQYGVGGTFLGDIGEDVSENPECGGGALFATKGYLGLVGQWAEGGGGEDGWG